MHVLDSKKARQLYRLFVDGHGVRAAARTAGVDRKTARRYLQRWQPYRAQLQAAYDAMCEGECERCDEINASIPDDMVIAMLNDWLDDQDGGEKSGWH
jgi:hypothetical protein